MKPILFADEMKDWQSKTLPDIHIDPACPKGRIYLVNPKTPRLNLTDPTAAMVLLEHLDSEPSQLSKMKIPWREA